MHVAPLQWRCMRLLGCQSGRYGEVAVLRADIMPCDALRGIDRARGRTIGWRVVTDCIQCWFGSSTLRMVQLVGGSHGC